MPHPESDASWRSALILVNSHGEHNRERPRSGQQTARAQVAEHTRRHRDGPEQHRARPPQELPGRLIPGPMMTDAAPDGRPGRASAASDRGAAPEPVARQRLLGLREDTTAA